MHVVVRVLFVVGVQGGVAGHMFMSVVKQKRKMFAPLYIIAMIGIQVQ